MIRLDVLTVLAVTGVGARACAVAPAVAQTVSVGIEAGATRAGFALSPADLSTESGDPGLTAGYRVAVG